MYALSEFQAAVYLEPATATLSEEPGAYIVIETQTMKIHAMDPSSGAKAWLAAGNLGSYKRIGYPLWAAALLVHALNNPA